MASPLKVLIVDDSALYRQTISNALRGISSIEVVGSAKDGTEALVKIDELAPDAITLDYEMPGLDGLEVLRRMRKKNLRTKAIMVSSYTEKGGKVTTDALMDGAFDFVLKPNDSNPEVNRKRLQTELLEKLCAIADTLEQEVKPQSHAAPIRDVDRSKFAESNPCDAIVIGASTGGPVLLHKVLSELPAELSVPIIIVQHMPAAFTGSLAKRLNRNCPLNVVETHDGQQIRPGNVYISAGGRHSKLIRRHQQIVVRLTDDPPECSCRPAVDYVLRSATEAYQGRVFAMILTGMGRDGTKGCEVLKNAGGFVAAQHADNCSVYGMPKSIIDAGLADHIVGIDDLSMLLCQYSAN